MKVTHDLTVVSGTYQRHGETKKRYENVGKVMTGDDGSEMMLLKRTFNPAGVPNPENRDSVVIYKFEIRPKTSESSRSSSDDFNDDIGF